MDDWNDPGDLAWMNERDEDVPEDMERDDFYEPAPGEEID